MIVDNDALALSVLQRVGYYALSGYSYSFRLKNLDGTRSDLFKDGTEFSHVKNLWEFDTRLRATTFTALTHLETHVRALLAYNLGAIDPLIHEDSKLLEVDSGSDYGLWRAKLDKKIDDSREEFIVHHRNSRSKVIPIWVAVEVLDWGGLSYLFSLSPLSAREKVAGNFGLNAPHLKSWLRALLVVRNVCAHHSRFFNRYYSLTPKLPRNTTDVSLTAISSSKDTTFAMLTLIQYLGTRTYGFNSNLLPAVLRTFPENSGMNIGAIGAPENWADLPLWC